MSSTEIIDLYKSTVKNTNNGTLGFQALKHSYHYIAIRSKIVNYKKLDAVP